MNWEKQIFELWRHHTLDWFYDGQSDTNDDQHDHQEIDGHGEFFFRFELCREHMWELYGNYFCNLLFRVAK